jgi:hypothetical protein
MNGKSLNAMIKIKTILNHGGACPFQIDALTDDDRMIYGRYRHGYIRVYIGRTGDLSEDAALDGELIFRKEVGRTKEKLKDLERGVRFFKLREHKLLDKDKVLSLI